MCNYLKIYYGNYGVFQNVTSFWVGNEIIIKFITLKHLKLKFKIYHGLVKIKTKITQIVWDISKCHKFLNWKGN